MLIKWDELDSKLKNDEVKKYYDILSQKKISLFFKRFYDIIFSVLMILILSPILKIIKNLIFLNSER